MTFASLFQDLILLFTFLLAGFVIREFVKPLQRFYIPASIVGGVLALVLGPQVLGWVEIPKSFFERILDEIKEAKGAKFDTDLTAEDLKQVIKNIIE